LVAGRAIFDTVPDVTTPKNTQPRTSKSARNLPETLEGYAPIPPQVTPVSIAAGRALVVVRESNIYEFLAFATMIRQVLESLAGLLPGVAEVLRLTGDDALIMRQGPKADALRERWNARVLTQGTKPYGYVFEVEGTTFLFAMTSAYSDAVEDVGNSFTEDLIETLKSARVVSLYTGPSTRLVRRKDLGERLGREAGERQIRIFTKEAPEGIDPLRTTGSMQWTFLCMQAENDLKATVTRLFTGRIFHMRRNEWLAGEGALPLGFTLESKSKQRLCVGDPAEVVRARLLIELACTANDQLGRPLREDEDLVDVATIVRRLSETGATKRSNKGKNMRGEQVAGAPLQSVTSPRLAVISLLGVLDAYSATGVLTRKQGLPLTGLTQHDVHGMTIYKPTKAGSASPGDDQKVKGTVLFEWTFPKPVDAAGKEVPWAAEEKLAGAAAYLKHLQTAREGEWSPRTVNPFSGLFTGSHNDHYYHFVHSGGGYQWRRSTRAPYYKAGGTAVGKFSASLVTRGFVEALLSKLENEGINPRQVQLTARPAKRAPDDAGAVLALEIAALEGKFDAAQRCAQEATSQRSRSSHQAAADELGNLLDLREEELRAIEAQSPEEPSDLEPDVLEVSSLATLLSVLVDADGKPTGPVVSEALNKIVVGGRISECWDDASPWGIFSCKVRVPTDRGIGRLVDISFEVGNTSQGSDRQAFARRTARVLAMRMTTSVTFDELSLRLGALPTPQHIGRTVHEALTPILEASGLPRTAASRAASALLDCPILSTRELVWKLLRDEPLPTVVEDLNEAETAIHIEALRDHYLSPQFAWNVDAWSAGGERLRREITRWVTARTLPPVSAVAASMDELIQALGRKSGDSIAYWHTYRPTEPLHDGTARVLIATRSETDASSLETGTRPKWVRPRPCPHCAWTGGLLPLPVPELGVDPVLCPQCSRQPGDPTHKFPASYHELWEGPFGRASTASREKRRVGSRVGTRRGRQPSMPSTTRSRRARPDHLPL